VVLKFTTLHRGSFLRGSFSAVADCRYNQTVPTGKSLYLESDPVHLNAEDNEIIAAIVCVDHELGVPMNKLSIVKEFWDFLKTRKRWWLIPIVVFLLMLGLVLVAAKGSALAPFIYSLF